MCCQKSSSNTKGCLNNYCSKKNLNKNTLKVSFVRHRDVHILTSGEQTFTSDQRFSARHNTEDEWVLLIKYVQVQYFKIIFHVYK